MASPTLARRLGLTGNRGCKAPVRAGISVNITLSGEQTAGGVALIDGDRALVYGQTDSTQNGIYDVSTGSWTRSLDADGTQDWSKGTIGLVTDGAQAGQFLQLTTTGDIVPGTSSMSFSVGIPTLPILAASSGSSLVGHQSQLANAILGTLEDRIYEVNAVADFGADPTGMTDSTDALANFFAALYDGCVAIIPPGLYLYTPVLELSTGVGYLNMDTLTGANLFGYGAIIRNNSAVTTAPATQGTLYGVHMLSCTDCNIHGLKFDGNRDTTYGTNGDGNEFYSAFYVTGSTRSKLVNCIGINCQGDGASFNRITGTTGFNNDCGIVGGYYGGNRRNEISVGGDYGWTIGGGVSLVGSSDSHRTNPKAGIDVEWEHATIGPTGNNTRTYIGAVSCSGTMAGGGIYVPNTSGVTIDGLRTYGLLGSSILIDNTHTGSYETQNVTIGPGCNLDSVYGIAIEGGANIHVIGAKIKASFPIIVNSALSAAPLGWVADINGCHIEGESTFAIQVLAGRTKFNNNMCVNCSSGGGNTYMGLFVPTCEVKNNTFTRDTNQAAPGHGLIFASSSSIVIGNTISSTTSITHPFVFGENSVAAYPKTQNNFYNGNPLPDTVATQHINCAVVDANVSTPQVLYTPFFGDNTELTALLAAVSTAGTGVTPPSTTTVSIGIAGGTTSILPATPVNIHALGDSHDFSGDSGFNGNTAYGLPVFATFAPGDNLPKLQFTAITRTNRASLYTSTVLFS